MLSHKGQHKNVSISLNPFDKLAISAECYMALVVIEHNLPLCIFEAN